MQSSAINSTKKIYFLAILIVVTIVSTTSATFAYFMATSSNNGNINGNFATVDIDLNVVRITPDVSNTDSLIPQLSANTINKTNALGLAIDSGCVDANGNVVCHIYKIHVKNTSTVTLRLNETLVLSGGTFNNLRWYTLASDDPTGNGVSSVPNSPTYSYPASFESDYGNLISDTILGDTHKLSPNMYRYFYVVIWIEEMGYDQGSEAAANKKDQGTFIGTITVNAIGDNNEVIKGVTTTFDSSASIVGSS